MVAIFIKGLLFYFLFVFIRNIFFGYKSLQQVKEGMGEAPKRGPSPRSKRGSDEGVVEAEYRVIKD